MKRWFRTIRVICAATAAAAALALPANALMDMSSLAEKAAASFDAVSAELEGKAVAVEEAAAEEAAAEEKAAEEVRIAEEKKAAAEKKPYELMPLYYQNDYPDALYGEGTVKTHGCSITCLAMVATYMTGHEYTPDELADYFGGKASNNMKRMEYGAEKLQLPYEKAENWHETLRALKDGKVAIALMNSSSIFTNSQHFIVLAGINEDGRIVVNDPNEANYDLWNLKEGFAEGFTEGQILRGYSGAWIFDKSEMPEDPFVYTEEKVEVEPRYPDIELTEEETELLACMIWVEARGESLEGQQAIAEIVFNRMKADNFPDTLKGVIYAEGQFASTAYLDEAEPNQTQYEVIENALEGPYVLPEDVVFFGRGAVNNNVWGKIGGHTFCYQWNQTEQEEAEPAEAEEAPEDAESVQEQETD